MKLKISSYNITHYSRQILQNTKTMNSNKLLTPSLTTYHQQLLNTQVTISSKKYKNHNKLYLLNLTKIKFKQKDTDISKNIPIHLDFEDPYQLIITNSLKNSSTNLVKIINGNHYAGVYTKDAILCNKLQKIKDIVSSQTNSVQLIKQQNKYQIVNQQKQQNLTIETPTSQKFHKQSQQDLSNHNKIKPIPQSQRTKLLSICAFDKLSTNPNINNNPNHKPSPKKPKHRALSLQKTSTKTLHKKIDINLCSLQKPMLNKQPLLPQIKLNIQKNKKNHHYTLNDKYLPPRFFFRDAKNLKNIKSQSFAIIQYPTGQLILSNKSINQYQIASLTKIMTFYTIQKISNKLNLSIFHQKVQINDHATQMSGTSAEIKVGEIYTVQQLLYGLMLPSGNDAATALAQWGGNLLLKYLYKNQQGKYQSKFRSSKYNNNIQQQHSLKQRIKIFINEMNVNAKQLGLKSTRYANHHGLCHSQSRSTVIDTGRLCIQCLHSQFFRKVVSTQQFKCTPTNLNKPRQRRQVIWKNTNKLLRRQGFIGIKTGTTVTAGPCLTSAYRFRDKIYICVILRATKMSRRFKQTRKLLAWSLQKLYKDSLSSQQCIILQKLKKNNPQLDSDYSQDEQQFNYDEKGKDQFIKRNHIVNCQM